ncbi:hypothetical protein CD30_00225 [Ureibacillus massiliensis 4400831 = CIP 108448 = CCUG 49529]|uniref:DUF3219 domain-containing protein n=1 Tax=Ureibacillus massiliensis 4400831 = CIP 108448 = CCUG 49529 TaxID=1211035 RepID=A0A0A3JAX1_9BACL|nr:DUF3219 family protein [Ureibacillus massiliensis]KGR92293.1 hypothetical protein CD30_00225 [Ureibacillus massiliensis 4400831 = CIP 108448 = CCUG 49529]
MVKEILLNDRVIPIESYEESHENGLYKIDIHFKVTSEDYHDIAVLLYEGSFNVKVEERNIAFRGTIQNYSTSITNLYEKGQVADYKLSLVEVKH